VGRAASPLSENQEAQAGAQSGEEQDRSAYDGDLYPNQTNGSRWRGTSRRRVDMRIHVWSGVRRLGCWDSYVGGGSVRPHSYVSACMNSIRAQLWLRVTDPLPTRSRIMDWERIANLNVAMGRVRRGERTFYR